ncbi:amidohydrolase family protein [Pseudoteredinibacter isoporae]|uniref:Imidazolonepropionase-like amidohydrolase n=1 Tax=Pseudoteredinibacter isoporae TaxID=570281 RepID=A0A7X0JVL7_9GAMM|nr:amidohydrolase family protein [Pseudoteredinibacter isoporae]MBB6522265.1 imidazolonepropionase-like amidohydrolase [Pseudoteredinibacter isoporae]NHO87798.1 amidohydrolase family protein [Pseudoteredinibacter isoporae]NIB23871.1 amidohydrolase family protein [Pseudoteredinibacter isoporae]
MKKTTLARFISASCFLAACSNVTEQTRAVDTPTTIKPAVTLYHNTTLIDGTGVPAQSHRSILVEGDRIRGIYPSDQLPALDKNTKRVDASEWYALPGLIDTHVHMATLPNDKVAKALLRRQIYSGVTSVRDMAGDGRALANLARRTQLQEIPAPDLFYAALMAGPSFFSDPRPGMSARGETPGQVPWMQAITEKTDMEEAVALARGSWATGIKIYANLETQEVERIAAEARKQGIQVWAHSMVFPALPNEVVAADVDVISHVCRLSFEISKKKPRQYHHKVVPDYASLDPAHPKILAIFKAMADKGIQLDATVWLYEELARMRREHPAAKTIPVKCPADFAARLTQVAYEQGVEISTGTDGMTPSSDLFPALFKELEILASKTQIPNAQLIRAATLNGAKVLGKESEFGSIEVGKKANLMFTRKNPLKNIEHLRTVELTLKSGKAYPRKEFKALGQSELKP